MTEYLIYAVIALQVLDVASTLYAFRNGAYERNKFMRRLTELLGAVPGLLLPKLIYAIPVWYYRADFELWGVVLVCVAYALVVVNNLRIANRRT